MSPPNEKQPLLTDFTFDNLGVPQNPDSPAGVSPAFVDVGLGGFLMTAGYDEDVYMEEWGKQKVPTPRNVDKGVDEGVVKAFTHNGYFKTLYGIVHFYNTRDVLDVYAGAAHGGRGTRRRLLAGTRGGGERQHRRTRRPGIE